MRQFSLLSIYIWISAFTALGNNGQYHPHSDHQSSLSSDSSGNQCRGRSSVKTEEAGGSCDQKREMTVLSAIRRIIIMGPPGSGKGTVSGRIQRTFDAFHLSSGDLLRAQISAGTNEGLLAEKFITNGALVPDEVMVNLILNALKDQESKMRSGSWLLDGFPRTVAQASSLHSSLPANFVINLDVPFDVIIDRVRGRWVHLASGRVYNEDWNPPKQPGLDDVTGEPLSKRNDDQPDTVMNRLDAYQQQTQPVLDFYRRIDPKLVHNFQGTETNVIWPMVKEFLDEQLLHSICDSS